jgi:ribosome-associated toxin RatA of RatAB toxin-antitoxin module
VIEGTEIAELLRPARDVYAVVADVERWPEWQRTVVAATALERDALGRPLAVAVELDAGIRTLRLILRFAYEPEARVAWQRQEGDLAGVDGAWELRPSGADRCHVTLRLAVDPGRRLGLLLRGGVADRARDRLVGGSLRDLRARVEGAAA